MLVNHKFFQRGTLAFLSLIVLAGCAVSPQQVAVNPATDAELPTAARSGMTVGLNVSDDRGTAVLGSLGGTYADSSTLSLSNDLSSDLRVELADKLRRAGYEVINSGGDFQIAVAISQLNYEVEPGSVSSEVRVVADLALRIEDEDGFLERSYRSGSNQTRITRPRADDNRMFLEEALNDSLSRLVQDERLHQFLRR
ncbi:MAG: YajG family lipoprotein [Natronospirillum sp.]